MSENKPNVFLITLASIFFVYILFLLFQFTNNSTGTREIGCTLEAKTCPDGSAVGRSGPKCEFETCPVVPTQSLNKPNPNTYFDKLLNIRFNFPEKYKIKTNNTTNGHFVMITGMDYRTELSEIGEANLGTYFTITENKQCNNPVSSEIKTLITKNDSYSLYSVKNIEGPDNKVAIFNIPNKNTCVNFYCSSDNLCQDSVLSDFQTILSSVKLVSNQDFDCGGIAGKLCPTGFNCQYDGNYPDASGICVK